MPVGSAFSHQWQQDCGITDEFLNHITIPTSKQPSGQVNVPKTSSAEYFGGSLSDSDQLDKIELVRATVGRMGRYTDNTVGNINQEFVNLLRFVYHSLSFIILGLSLH